MSDIRVTVPPLEDLKAAFAKFDTESSGAIPVHDLGALLRSVGVVELKEDELQALISEEMFDKNFDLPEFLALMRSATLPRARRRRASTGCHEAAADGDGFDGRDRQALDGMAGHGPLADDEFEIMLAECRRDAEVEDGEPIKIDAAVRFFLTS